MIRSPALVVVALSLSGCGLQASGALGTSTAVVDSIGQIEALPQQLILQKIQAQTQGEVAIYEALHNLKASMEAIDASPGAVVMTVPPTVVTPAPTPAPVVIPTPTPAPITTPTPSGGGPATLPRHAYPRHTHAAGTREMTTGVNLSYVEANRRGEEMPRGSIRPTFYFDEHLRPVVIPKALAEN